MKKITLLFAIFSFNFIIGQSIISVSPNNGNRGQNLQVSITAQDIDFNETSDATGVYLIDQYSNVLPATWFYVWSSNQINAYFSIPGYAVPGQYDVNVSETGGLFNMTLPGGFTVNNSYTYSIQGNIRYDSNENGCDASDINIPNQRIVFTNGSTSGNIYTDQSGFYNYYDVHVGNNNFIPAFSNYFTVTPPNVNVNISSTNNLVVQDFCVSPNGVHNDLEINVFPIDMARPGFNSQYIIKYKNKGTHSQSGSVTLNFDDSVLDYVISSPAIDGQVTNQLSWNFTNLIPFEERMIYFTLNLNTPTETPPVNAGNILTYTATIQGLTDETPSDNTSTLNQTVVNSFDPNDKTCTEGSNLPIGQVGKDLHYVIRFENTGTANAENIVVRDVIDTSKFDIATLVPLAGSHPFTTKILNTNQVEFIFENINLPFDDANNDGFVAFKIKSKPNLTVGSAINNTAEIFFDYNLPIVTNTSTVTVFDPLMNTNDFGINNYVILSPIPVKNMLNITLNKPMTISEIKIYNSLGQLVISKVNPNHSIDVSNLESGNYFVKIITDKGILNEKFIKE